MLRRRHCAAALREAWTLIGQMILIGAAEPRTTETLKRPVPPRAEQLEKVQEMFG